MAKPSIFSRDYERRMKRRKRNITIITVIIVALAIIIFVRFEVVNTDFSNLRSKIQAWVDSGKQEEETKEDEEEAKPEQQKQPEQVEAPKDLTLDFTMPNGVIVKAKYSDQNGAKVFESIEENNGIIYSINPSKNKIIITDQNQNILLGNIDGTSKDLTKHQYLNTKGNAINKDEILQTYPQDVWHGSTKFIDDNMIVYYSNLPYVGSGVQDKYFWIVNTTTGEDQKITGLVGTEVSIGNLDPANGIEVSVNGYNYFIKADGTYIQKDAAVNKNAKQEQKPVQNEQQKQAQQPAE